LFKVKQLGIPIAEQPKPEPQPLLNLLTLREMQDIDPYDFPVIADKQKKYMYISVHFRQHYNSFFLCRKLAAVALSQLFV